MEIPGKIFELFEKFELDSDTVRWIGPYTHILVFEEEVMSRLSAYGKVMSRLSAYGKVMNRLSAYGKVMNRQLLFA